MKTIQGDLALLDSPLGMRLLASTARAQLSYDWRHGTPRVMATWFSWDGDQFILWTARLPTSNGLTTGSRVVLTVTSKHLPFRVLMVRGSIRQVTEVRLATPGKVVDPQEQQIRFGAAYDGTSAVPFSDSRVMRSKMTQLGVRAEWVGIADDRPRKISETPSGNHFQEQLS